MLFGLFYLEAANRGAGAIAVLAFENRGRIGRDQLVAFEHKLGIKTVARRLVNGLAAEVAVKFVFVIVVAAEAQFLAVRRELFFFVQNHELRRVPSLARFAHVAPEFEDRAFEIAVADKIIAGGFRRDFLRGIDSGLLNPRGHRSSAAGQEKRTEKNRGGNKSKRAFVHGQFPLSQRTDARNLLSPSPCGRRKDCGNAALALRTAKRLQNTLHRAWVAPTMVACWNWKFTRSERATGTRSSGRRPTSLLACLPVY